MIKMSKKAWIWIAAVLIAFGLAPWLFTEDQYLLRVFTLIIFWIGLSGCWNLMSGYTGYVDFGPVVYFGIGSYVTAIGMTKFGGSFFVCAPLGGVIAGLIALPIGAVALRLRGAYFAIATFAFAESMKQICLEFDRTFGISLFEGSHGITLPITDYENMFFYYCVLAVTFTVMMIHVWVERSKYGLGLKAIHEAEDSAEIAGVNTMDIKLRAYMISAAFIGIMGGIEVLLDHLHHPRRRVQYSQNRANGHHDPHGRSGHRVSARWWARPSSRSCPKCWARNSWKTT